jgi:cellulose synthase/poly-beta-1,6-N-acetylglucosamine synthase-like glycosyltransferase
MFGFFEVVLLCVFLFFYAGLFYNLPVLAAGVRDVRRSRRVSKLRFRGGSGGLPFISLILPVKNEERVVGRLLDALSRVNYPSDLFEVVVVDDGSVDGTAGICMGFAAGSGNVRFFRREVSNGKANALNYGLQYCRGEIVGVFDADNVIAGDALVNAAAYFEDARVAAVQGRIHSINSHENMLTQFIAYEEAVWSEAYLRGKEVLGLFVHLRGCCEFIRREVLEASGGFDERTLAEDIELSARLTRDGYRIKYAPDVWAWQENPARLKTFLKQRTRWFRGHLEVAFRFGSLLSHVNRRTVDAEVTLFLPLVAIASMFSYWIASFALFSAAPFDLLLRGFMVFSTVGTSLLVVLCGLAMIYVSKPRRIRSLLWVPFVFGYWCLESFLALYAALLIALRRPHRWVKTEKSGAVASPEFSAEVSTSFAQVAE